LFYRVQMKPMKKNSTLLFASLLVLSLFGCIRDNTQSQVKLNRFVVTIPPSFNIGDPDNRLPFALEPVNIPIHIEAIGTDGKLFPFTGRLLTTVEPGQVVGGGDLLIMTNGISDSNIPLRLAFGDSAIWIHEVDPVNGNAGALTCSGGCQSGSACYRGRICAGPNASLSMGIAGPIFFENPRISDLQTTQDPNTSTLVNESLTISGGTMIVTGISGQGFFVTDIADEDQQFNSILVFTFNQPEEVGLGDRLAKISGIAAEFVGTTQLTQPGFDVIEESRVDLIPAPKEITVQEAGDLSGRALEPFESSLVMVRNATLASDYVHCDGAANGGNNNNLIDTDSERSCSDACFAEPSCSELTNFLRFGQYAVLMDNGQTKIQVVSRDTVRGFDPTLPENLGKTIPQIIGTLRDVQFADPRAVIQPRFPSDIVLE
jgi:hypothetical protein